MSLGCTLPCKFCAKSYRKFMKELDIDNFLDGKRNLMYWVYLMHNKVNKTLELLSSSYSDTKDSGRNTKDPETSRHEEDLLSRMPLIVWMKKV